MLGETPKIQEDIALLVLKAKKGERAAFDLIHARYLTPIYRFVYMRVKSSEDAEDITQMVFLKAWKALATFEERGLPFSSLLYKIARNATIDFWKRKKETRLDDHEEFASQIKDEHQDPRRDFERKERKGELLNAVATLSEDQQEVITLKFIEDLSNKEIAELTGKSEEAVRALQYRALKELRNHFHEA